MNTSMCAAVAPLLPVPRRRWLRRGEVALAAAAASLALAACGGSAPSAGSVLRETFSSHRPLSGGVVDVSLELTGPGGHRGPHGFSLLLEGPFQSAGAGRLPDFALGITLETEHRVLTAGAISTAGRLYLQLGGQSFAVPSASARALTAGYAPFGIEPRAWLRHPAVAGTAHIAGAEVTHIVAGLDAPRFLADAERLSSAGLALGEALGASLLTPARSAALSTSVGDGRVDVYTGSPDHRLRRLLLRAAVSSGPAARTALGDLAGGTLRLGLQFAELGQPQTITPPARPLPPSQLGPALERVGQAAASRPPA